MKPDCLNERDLILLHFGEAPDGTTSLAANNHLASCHDCQTRRERLATDLARLPSAADPEPLATTRVIARVSERLQQKRRWLPMTWAAAAVAMVLAVVIWLPFNKLESPLRQQPIASIQPQVSVPPSTVLDLDMVDQLDLLEDLETLQAIEGV